MPNPQGQGADVVLADLNGDGLKDIVEYWGSTDTPEDRCSANVETGEWPDCRWRMRLNGGAGFGPLVDLPKLKGVERGGAFALDVDGDGGEELIALSGDNDSYRIHWYDEGQPAHFVSTASGLRRQAGSEARTLVDVNGDGLKDVVTANDQGLDGPGLAHQLLLYVNTGRDFRPAEAALAAPPDLPEFGGGPLTLMGLQLGLALTLDYDGDGAEDVLLPYPDRPVVPGDPGTSFLTRWLLLQAEDGRLRQRSIALEYEPGGSFYGDFLRLAAQGPRAVDYNGDGYRDFVGVDRPGGKLVAHTHDPGGEAKADVVVAVDDGAAAFADHVPAADRTPTVEIEYAHLLDGPFYRQHNGAPCAH
ncbi:MAG TPA: FG-GAP-like repeat-containing protein, partial [Polyangiaceae bacterium]|nr:FG-GAP-like repeat-containing protein [Polyangiaceae bacterium]